MSSISRDDHPVLTAPMLRSRIDHLVVTAPTLDEGSRWVEDQLGVAPHPGGRHMAMATHNRLLRLGERCYLEVISIDPTATTPNRPRWFDLDTMRAPWRPRLAAWMAATNTIEADAETASAILGQPDALGAIEAMSRDHWRWRLTVPSGGRLLLNGCAPALFSWIGSDHPAAHLPDDGLQLVTLQLAAEPSPDLVRWPEPQLVQLLSALHIEPRVQVVTGQQQWPLLAIIDTPLGRRTLAAA